MGFLLLVFTCVLFFIANSYDKRKSLQTVEEEPLEPIENQTVIGSYTYYDANRSIIIGDSRMYLASKIITDDNIIFVAQNGATCDYLWGTAEKEVENILKDNPDEHFNIFFNLGVNDLNRMEKGIKPDGKTTCDAKIYSDYYLGLKEKWSNHNLFFISVNPVDKEKMENSSKHKNGTNNEKIEKFNTDVEKAIKTSGFYYCDIYTKLLEEGFESYDGLHYSDEVTKKIIEETKKCSERYEKEKRKLQNLFSIS